MKRGVIMALFNFKKMLFSKNETKSLNNYLATDDISDTQEDIVYTPDVMAQIFKNAGVEFKSPNNTAKNITPTSVNNEVNTNMDIISATPTFEQFDNNRLSNSSLHEKIQHSREYAAPTMEDVIHSIAGPRTIKFKTSTEDDNSDSKKSEGGLSNYGQDIPIPKRGGAPVIEDFIKKEDVAMPIRGGTPLSPSLEDRMKKIQSYRDSIDASSKIPKKGMDYSR